MQKKSWQQLRVAGEDCSWFFRNGLVIVEKSIGKQIQDDMSIMYSYDSNVAATVDYDHDKQNNDELDT